MRNITLRKDGITHNFTDTEIADSEKELRDINENSTKSEKEKKLYNEQLDHVLNQIDVSTSNVGSKNLVIKEDANYAGSGANDMIMNLFNKVKTNKNGQLVSIDDNRELQEYLKKEQFARDKAKQEATPDPDTEEPDPEKGLSPDVLKEYKIIKDPNLWRNGHKYIAKYIGEDKKKANYIVFDTIKEGIPYLNKDELNAADNRLITSFSKHDLLGTINGINNTGQLYLPIYSMKNLKSLVLDRGVESDNEKKDIYNSRFLFDNIMTHKNTTGNANSKIDYGQLLYIDDNGNLTSGHVNDREKFSMTNGDFDDKTLQDFALYNYKKTYGKLRFKVKPYALMDQTDILDLTNATYMDGDKAKHNDFLQVSNLFTNTNGSSTDYDKLMIKRNHIQNGEEDTYFDNLGNIIIPETFQASLFDKKRNKWVHGTFSKNSDGDYVNEDGTINLGNNDKNIELRSSDFNYLKNYDIPELMYHNTRVNDTDYNPYTKDISDFTLDTNRKDLTSDEQKHTFSAANIANALDEADVDIYNPKAVSQAAIDLVVNHKGIKGTIWSPGNSAGEQIPTKLRNKMTGLSFGIMTLMHNNPEVYQNLKKEFQAHKEYGDFNSFIKKLSYLSEANYGEYIKLDLGENNKDIDGNPLQKIVFGNDNVEGFYGDGSLSNNYNKYNYNNPNKKSTLDLINEIGQTGTTNTNYNGYNFEIDKNLRDYQDSFVINLNLNQTNPHITKHLSGGVIGEEETEIEKQQAKEASDKYASYKSRDYAKGETKSSTLLSKIAVGTDAVMMTSAFIPVVGTAVAAVAGIAGVALRIASNSVDKDGWTKADAREAGLDVGMTALCLIPGFGATKFAKGLHEGNEARMLAGQASKVFDVAKGTVVAGDAAKQVLTGAAKQEAGEALKVGVNKTAREVAQEAVYKGAFKDVMSADGKKIVQSTFTKGETAKVFDLTTDAGLAEYNATKTAFLTPSTGKYAIENETRIRSEMMANDMMKNIDKSVNKKLINQANKNVEKIIAEKEVATGLNVTEEEAKSLFNNELHTLIKKDCEKSLLPKITKEVKKVRITNGRAKEILGEAKKQVWTNSERMSNFFGGIHIMGNLKNLFGKKVFKNAVNLGHYGLMGTGVVNGFNASTNLYDDLSSNDYADARDVSSIFYGVMAAKGIQQKLDNNGLRKFTKNLLNSDMEQKLGRNAVLTIKGPKGVKNFEYKFKSENLAASSKEIKNEGILSFQNNMNALKAKAKANELTTFINKDFESLSPADQELRSFYNTFYNTYKKVDLTKLGSKSVSFKKTKELEMDLSKIDAISHIDLSKGTLNGQRMSMRQQRYTNALSEAGFFKKLGNRHIIKLDGKTFKSKVLTDKEYNKNVINFSMFKNKTGLNSKEYNVRLDFDKFTIEPHSNGKPRALFTGKDGNEFKISINNHLQSKVNSEKIVINDQDYLHVEKYKLPDNLVLKSKANKEVLKSTKTDKNTINQEVKKIAKNIDLSHIKLNSEKNIDLNNMKSKLEKNIDLNNIGSMLKEKYKFRDSENIINQKMPNIIKEIDPSKTKLKNGGLINKFQFGGPTNGYRGINISYFNSNPSIKKELKPITSLFDSSDPYINGATNWEQTNKNWENNFNLYGRITPDYKDPNIYFDEINNKLKENKFGDVNKKEYIIQLGKQDNGLVQYYKHYLTGKPETPNINFNTNSTVGASQEEKLKAKQILGANPLPADEDEPIQTDFSNIQINTKTDTNTSEPKQYDDGTTGHILTPPTPIKLKYNGFYDILNNYIGNKAISKAASMTAKSMTPILQTKRNSLTETSDGYSILGNTSADENNALTTQARNTNATSDSNLQAALNAKYDNANSQYENQKRAKQSQYISQNKAAIAASREKNDANSDKIATANNAAISASRQGIAKVYSNAKLETAKNNMQRNKSIREGKAATELNQNTINQDNLASWATVERNKRQTEAAQRVREESTRILSSVRQQYYDYVDSERKKHPGVEPSLTLNQFQQVAEVLDANGNKVNFLNYYKDIQANELNTLNINLNNIDAKARTAGNMRNSSYSNQVSTNGTVWSRLLENVGINQKRKTTAYNDIDNADKRQNGYKNGGILSKKINMYNILNNKK